MSSERAIRRQDESTAMLLTRIESDVRAARRRELTAERAAVFCSQLETAVYMGAINLSPAWLAALAWTLGDTP